MHLAARLQQAATAGTTWISDATFKLAFGRIETRAIGMEHFRGFQTPVLVHELQAADPSLSRLDVAGRRGLSIFVDRRGECGLLEAAYEKASHGKGCSIALVGEAGVGKSRLIREFVASRAGSRVLEVKCTRWRDEFGFHPIRVLTRRLLGLDEVEDLSEVQERLEMTSRSGKSSTQAVAAVADLHGLGSHGPAIEPNARRRRMIDECLALLLNAASDKPLLIVIDDVHWTDDDTGEVIRRLLDYLDGKNVLVVLGWRPDFSPEWQRHPALKVVPLRPLTAEDARSLARSVLGERANNDNAIAELADRAAGNPFFIEEAANMPDVAAVPPTVRDVLATRLDRLKPYEKQLIELLATIGEPASAELLHELVDDHEGMETEGATAELERAGLVRIDGVAGNTRFACRHSLLQEVAYRSLTRARRRALHERVLTAIERVARDRATAEAELLARHARLGEVWESALKYARAAGARAAFHSANRRSARFYEEALDALSHLPEGAETRSAAIDLRFALRDPLFRLGEIAQLRSRLDEAAALAEQLGDASRLGQLCIFQSHHAWLAGDYVETIAAANRAASLAEVQHDAALKLRATFERALGEYGKGKPAASVSGMAEVAAGAEQPQVAGRFGLDAPLTVVALGYQARALTDLEEFDSAARIVAACAARASQIARPFTSIFACIAEGYLLLGRGAARAAIAPLAQALADCDRAEADVMRPIAQSFLGAAEARSGSPEAGARRLELAVQSAASMGFLFQQPLRLALLAEALALADRQKEAAQRAAEALALASSQGERLSYGRAARIAAELAR